MCRYVFKTRVSVIEQTGSGCVSENIPNLETELSLWPLCPRPAVVFKPYGVRTVYIKWTNMDIGGKSFESDRGERVYYVVSLCGSMVGH